MKEQNENLEVHGDITLNLMFWDCECEKKFIHSIAENQCTVCKALEEDCPNSRADEVEEYFKEGVVK
jgi:hypothetical protein